MEKTAASRMDCSVGRQMAPSSAHHGDDAGARHVDQAQRAHQADEGVELLGRPVSSKTKDSMVVSPPGRGRYRRCAGFDAFSPVPRFDQRHLAGDQRPPASEVATGETGTSRPELARSSAASWCIDLGHRSENRLDDHRRVVDHRDDGDAPLASVMSSRFDRRAAARHVAAPPLTPDTTPACRPRYRRLQIRHRLPPAPCLLRKPALRRRRGPSSISLCAAPDGIIGEAVLLLVDQAIDDHRPSCSIIAITSSSWPTFFGAHAGGAEASASLTKSGSASV